MTVINEAKSKTQEKAKQAFRDVHGWGAEYLATGSGKSKIAIDLADEVIYKILLEEGRTPNIYLIVPTRKLRDDGWEVEFKKWGSFKDSDYSEYVKKICYASLDKILHQEIDFLIFDEGHNLTESGAEVLERNTVHNCLLMTATKPTDRFKVQMLKKYKLYEPVFELTLDEAEKLGLIAPYKVIVINIPIDDIDNYIPQKGRRGTINMVTEKERYNSISAMAMKMGAMGFIKRMQFIYNLRSKTQAAKWIIDNVIPKDLRTLIFCGSKDQANYMCPYRYYSKPAKPKKLEEGKKYTENKLKKYQDALAEYLRDIQEWQGDESYQKFEDFIINQIACVNSLNEGHNIPKLDIGFIIQLNKSVEDLVQRMGRVLRHREGHTGIIVVLRVIGTIDERWVDNAMDYLDKSKITYINYEDLKSNLIKLW